MRAKTMIFGLMLVLGACEGGSLPPPRESIIMAYVVGEPAPLTGPPGSADVRAAIIERARQMGMTVAPQDIVQIICAKGFKDMYRANAVKPPGMTLEQGAIVRARVGTPFAFVQPGDFDVILDRVQSPRLPAPELLIDSPQTGAPLPKPPQAERNYVQTGMNTLRLSCYAQP